MYISQHWIISPIFGVKIKTTFKNHHLDEVITLPVPNIAAKNQSLEDEFPFGARPILKGALAVSFRECICKASEIWECLESSLETTSNNQQHQQRLGRELCDLLRLGIQDRLLTDPLNGCGCLAKKTLWEGRGVNLGNAPTHRIHVWYIYLRTFS